MGVPVVAGLVGTDEPVVLPVGVGVAPDGDEPVVAGVDGDEVVVPDGWAEVRCEGACAGPTRGGGCTGAPGLSRDSVMAAAAPAATRPPAA